MSKNIVIVGPMNTGTNLIEKILINLKCLDLHTNQVVTVNQKEIWKHTIMKNEIESVINDKNNLVIFMYKNLFNWLYSIKKSPYEIEFTKLNEHVKLTSVEFKNIIDLYNYYYDMYIYILNNNENCLFMNYYEIINENNCYEYINNKLHKINIKVCDENNLLNEILNTPSKTHGFPVDNASIAFNNYNNNNNLVKNYIFINILKYIVL